MTRKTLITIVAASAVLTILLASSVRRVGPDRQAVLARGGKVEKTLASGFHFLMPFSNAFVAYPVGIVEMRVPESGKLRLVTRDGLEATMAVHLRLEFRPLSASSIYEALGEDYRAALTGAVAEAAEIGAAGISVSPGDSVPPGFLGPVLNDALMPAALAGVVLKAYKIDEWNVGGGAALFEVEPAPLRKVILVGVDGADWTVIGELMGRDRLPNLERIVEGGASGPLRSIEPLLSPLLWTTIATGKLPEEHGILNFTVADPETGRKVPISRLSRRVDAFWNMLGDYGRRVDVVGWLATHPAENIHGVMVSDRVGYLAYAEAEKDGHLLPGSLAPAERREEIEALVGAAGSVAYPEFKRFIELGEDEFVRNRSLAFDPKNPVNDMIMLYASTQTYRRIANRLLEKDDPACLAVYFELVDATKHLFMEYAPPRQPHVDEGSYRKFHRAVEEAYVLQDEILGELLERGDENTVLMIVSDHGFKSGSARPRLSAEIWAGNAAFWHLADGIVCLYGNGIRKGARIEGASILDVAPTVLALQGLPKPADMKGRVLSDAFEPALAERLNRASVATLERERADETAGAGASDAAAEEALKKLEALGYIAGSNPDQHNNLGQRYQAQGEFEKAIEEFKRALALRPDFPGALNNLGVCYGRLKRYGEAEEAFKKTLELKPDDVYAMGNLAIMHLELGDLDEALRYAKESVKVEPNYANGHLTLGSVYATMAKFDEAAREFEKVLELDPGNENAKRNLERVRTRRAGGP